MADKISSSFKYFLDGITSEDDLVTVTGDLATVKTLIFQRGRKSLVSKITGRVSGGFLETVELLSAKKILPGDSGGLEDYFERLEEYIKSLGRVNLTLAFEPSRKFLEEIAEWFEKNLGKKVILAILVKEEIIGGVQIEYNGKYKDYSKGELVEKVVRNPPSLSSARKR